MYNIKFILNLIVFVHIYTSIFSAFGFILCLITDSIFAYYITLYIAYIVSNCTVCSLRRHSKKKKQNNSQ